MIDTEESLPPRVVMLVQNSVEFDSRVRKEAESLAAAGFEVWVVGVTAAHLPDRENVRNVNYLRVSVQRNLPWLYARVHSLASLRPPLNPGSIQLPSRLIRRSLVSVTGRLSQMYFERRARLLDSVRLEGALPAAEGLNDRRRLATAFAHSPLLLLEVASAWVGYRVATGLRQHTKGLWVRAKLPAGTMRRRRRVLERRLTINARKLVGPVSLYVDYALAVRSVVDDLAPHAVHAHDLNTLFAGMVVARRNRAKLVYDAHELELHRNQEWTRWKRILARSVEVMGMRRAHGVITVSPLIAEELARVYRVRRPTVVLNSPSLLTRSLEAAMDLRAAAALAPTDRLIVYVGTIGYRRGLDQLVRALALMPPNFHVGFLGPRQPIRERPLQELGEELGVAARMHFFGPVPAERVPSTLAAADGTVNPAPNVCRSYDFALPNKLFDAVMAGVPIGVGQLRHLSEFVTTHDVGTVFDEEEPASIALALQAMSERWWSQPVDVERLDELQTLVAWEAQEAKLYALYDELGMSPSPRLRPAGAAR